MDAIQKMLQRWREERVPLNEGAGALQLESLERLIGQPLPSDVRAFYTAADGMPDYQQDPRMVSMWSIERVMRERNIHEGEDEWGVFQDLAFADVLFSAWFLRLRIRENGGAVILAELTNEELPSFYALFDAFLQRPRSLGLSEASPPN
ncbi:MAG TPA: SMI1/KNR4 family protein [Burkholderiales bacterium]|nr:SMI1/KNR4 family protein [Burkholderiales bacterium]